MIGLARAMVVDPGLPNVWLKNERGDIDFPRFESPSPGSITAWYTMRLHAISEDREKETKLDLHTAQREYEKRDRDGCTRWQTKFVSEFQ